MLGQAQGSGVGLGVGDGVGVGFSDGVGAGVVVMAFFVLFTAFASWVGSTPIIASAAQLTAAFSFVSSLAERPLVVSCFSPCGWGVWIARIATRIASANRL